MISLNLFVLLITVESVSVDCPNLLKLAEYLGLQTAKPDIWVILSQDCCASTTSPNVPTGITCVNGIVNIIRWNNFGLTGYINGTAIPSTIYYLDLSYNQLSGSIPNTLPGSLYWANLQQNQFSGGIPTSLPSALNYFDVSDNFLTGSIPTTLPSNIVTLYLDHNQLSGDIPALPLTITSLSLGFNGFPGNHFTGTLILQAPSDVYINDNWITNVIIRDPSSLRNCDLSNNPLLGNPNIDNLPCRKNDLYSANLLSATVSTSQSKTTTKLAISNTKINSFSFVKTSGTFSVIYTTAALTTIIPNKMSSTSEVLSDTNLAHIWSYDATDAVLPSTTNVYSLDSTLLGNSENQIPDSSELSNPYLIYGIFGALAALCILVLIGSFMFKHPKMHSKYGRKNSFGTLNTVATTKTRTTVKTF